MQNCAVQEILSSQAICMSKHMGSQARVLVQFVPTFALGGLALTSSLLARGRGH